jgi:hypothetical protein
MPVLEKRYGFIVGSPLPDQAGRRDVFVNSRIVDSSNVESVAWPTTGEPLMIVRYKGGGLYGYYPVSRQRAVAAAYYPSTGKYINDRIKPNFKAVKLK